MGRNAKVVVGRQMEWSTYLCSRSDLGKTLNELDTSQEGFTLHSVVPADPTSGLTGQKEATVLIIFTRKIV